MYSTFFGECSSLKKRSYLSQWGFKQDNSNYLNDICYKKYINK